MLIFYYYYPIYFNFVPFFLAKSVDSEVKYLELFFNFWKSLTIEIKKYFNAFISNYASNVRLELVFIENLGWLGHLGCFLRYCLFLRKGSGFGLS